jgi:hypothetical protein
VRYVYPKGAPSWRRRNEQLRKTERTGDPIKFVLTNNVLFRLASAGDIRFEESLRFIGGEDVLFFDTLAKCGSKIIFSREAKTFETVPWERISVKSIVRRSYVSGFARIRDARRMAIPVRVSYLKLSKRFVLGALRVMVSPLCFPLGFGLQTFTSGARNLAFCAGTLAAFTKAREVESYRKTNGY